jgi:cytochrome P450 family 2 subfamily U polypeptide 1
MKVVLTDLFVAGSETSATTLQWGILYMITHPEIQRKVQTEIDEVLGQDRIPTMHERLKLPFTEATVLETHRCTSLVSLGLPHCNLNRDVTFRNFTIPKGAMVMPNIWAVHRDPEIWKYPDVFDPRNFLDDEGCVVHKNELIPFSIGKGAAPKRASKIHREIHTAVVFNQHLTNNFIRQAVAIFRSGGSRGISPIQFFSQQ